MESQERHPSSGTPSILAYETLAYYQTRSTATSSHISCESAAVKTKDAAVSASPGVPLTARLAPELADGMLRALIKEFEQTGSPVHVCFRDILTAPSGRNRAIHDLHPYPARLLINIPSFFLSTSLSHNSEVVLDPFCGSGTVLLEAILQGRNATGADSNPLARLITRTKLTPLSSDSLKATRRSFFRRLPGKPRRDYPKVVNLEYWFSPHVRHDLLRLLENIETIQEEAIRDFFYVTFSASLKEVSLADPRLSVPVRLRETQYPRDHWLHERTKRRLLDLRTINVVEVFEKKLDDNINRAEHLESCSRPGEYLGLAADARALTHLADESVDLIITSPPYLGAQKYIRASSLSLTWLGLCEAGNLRSLEDRNIGREHYPRSAYSKAVPTGLPKADALLSRVGESNPLRAHIAAIYLCEMRDAFRELSRVLKRSRFAVILAGASSLCGTPFPTPSFLVDIAQQEGFSLCLHLVDPIRSRALMTKRHHTAGRIDAESILLLRRNDNNG